MMKLTLNSPKKKADQQKQEEKKAFKLKPTDSTIKVWKILIQFYIRYLERLLVQANYF